MRDNNFNFLRLFAGISVLMGHLSSHMKIPAFGYDVSTVPFYHLGVPFFLILTGFLLYPSFSNLIKRGDSLKIFYTKRFLRIAPSIYFVTIVTVILFYAVGAINVSVFKDFTFWGYIFTSVILFPVYHPDIFSHIGIGVLNGSLWTIVAQVSFFIIIPFIYIYEKKFGTKKMIISLMVFAILCYFFGAWVGKESLITKVYSVSVFDNLIYFALGIFWAKYWKVAPKSIWIFFLSVLLLFIFRQDILRITPYIGGSLQHLLWVLPLSYATIWFGHLGPKLFRKFNKVEDIGMGIYIWHMIVINLFLYFGVHEISWITNYLMYFIVIGVTVVLAYISRIFIEKPALNLQNKNKSISIRPKVPA